MSVRQGVGSIAASASNWAASSLYVLAFLSARSAAQLMHRPVATTKRYKVKGGSVRFGGKWITLHQFRRLQVCTKWSQCNCLPLSL